MLRPFFIVLALVFATLPHSELATLDAEQLPQLSSEEADPLGWVVTVGGFGEDSINALVPLSNNSVLAGGSFTSSILIGDNGHDSTQLGFDDSDGFIAIANETNEWNFSESFGSIGVDSVNALALMSDGDFIVAGNYCLGSAGLQCNMTLGSLPTLDKEADSEEGNAYIARYDIDSGWQWAVSIANQQEVLMFDMFVDEYDQIHVGVLFKELLDMNQTIFAGGSQPSLAVMVFDEYGIFSDGFSAMSEDGVEPFGSFCQNSVGDTFVTLTFIGELAFDGIGSVESNGGGDIVVAKFDETGWVWLQQAGGTGDDLVNGCVAGAGLDVQVFGTIEGNATFGLDSSETTQWFDAFQADITTDGVWDGLNVEGGAGYDMFSAAYRTSSGSVILAGVTTYAFTLGGEVLVDYDDDLSYFGTDIFLAEYDFDNDWQWALLGGSDGRDRVNDIVASSSGGSMIAFSFEDSGLYGNHSVIAVGDEDGGVWHYETDLDGDGVLDGIDNCPRVSNADQANFESDMFGDVCDDDDDNDGYNDLNDKFPLNPNEWYDNDNDGLGDNEDEDDDNDSWSDTIEISCNTNPLDNSSFPNDYDGDLIPDCIDQDTDNDGYPDNQDDFPENELEWIDTDKDGIGDNEDKDDDGDGYSDNDEIICESDPLNSNSKPDDLDQDFVPNCIDLDDDNDGCLDDDDAFPFDNSECLDNDDDGIGDNADDDDDNDGVYDLQDAFPFNSAEQKDTDGDGIGDNSDSDYNSDGLRDDVLFPSQFFSPNGDGINDTWNVVNTNLFPNCEVWIYTRSGELIFNKKGYANDWTGLLNGQPIPEASYVYMVDQDGDGIVDLKGWFYLTR